MLQPITMKIDELPSADSAAAPPLAPPEKLAAIGAVLRDPARPLKERFRALFTLRNLPRRRVGESHQRRLLGRVGAAEARAGLLPGPDGRHGGAARADRRAGGHRREPHGPTRGR